MGKKFLHLAIHFKNGGVTEERLGTVEEVLNKAADWVRYVPNCWLIYTGRDAEVWHQRLKNIPWITQQQYFICEIDIHNKAGWLPKAVWEWMNKDRSAV